MMMWFKRILLILVSIPILAILFIVVMNAITPEMTKEEIFDKTISKINENVVVLDAEIEGFRDLSISAHFKANSAYFDTVINSQNLALEQGISDDERVSYDPKLTWSENPGKVTQYVSRNYNKNDSMLIQKITRLFVNENRTEGFYFRDSF